jgi:gliding motility-associated-like protein
MRKGLIFRQVCLALLVFSTCGELRAQNHFTFNCSRDTLLAGCGTGACITLQSIIPDIKASTASYVVNPATNIPGCFPATIDPGGSGTPTNLTIDDTYSAPINIGFPFTFFGSTYNQLIASTNGYVSFDVGLSGFFSHWDIINGTTPQNLPSTFYDRALIMGPYHDLNPSYTTSPSRKIQYSTIGTAPHRKWILSFYKVPLFLTPVCSNLIENTHQIVLYESTGLIEVFIYSKQICMDWNEGRAMVGLQSFDRTQGIMAPGRAATDNPWGSIGMNETWRFVPATGNSLLKRVELLDLAGNILQTGTTAASGTGNLLASFPNVCSQVGITPYIVRSVYQKNDDPNVEIFGMDTVRVNVSNSSSLNASAVAGSTNCGNNTGSITVTANGGTAPLQYALNGGSFQSGNVFNGLAQNSYTITVRDAAGCQVTTTATVTLQNNLSLTLNGDDQVCLGGSFTPTVTSNATTYSWSPTTGVSDPNVATPTITPTGTTTYTLTATLGVCTDQESFTLTVAPGATANAGPDAFVLLGDSHQLSATASQGTYLWTPSAGLSSTTILNPLATPQLTTTYTLNVTSPLGCIASDQVTITVVPYCVKPMNAFTPNGDGINDLWLITDDMSCINKMTAQVFNRYGAKVFESNDYKNNWNGTRGGQPLPDGTYYYVISYNLINGDNLQMKGNVTILR